jgi:acetyltransferase-like isoleucine patch superfamily enzyme
LTKFIYQLYNYKTQIKVREFWNILYSFWVKNTFKKCGNNFNVVAPLSLKGSEYISIGNNFHSINTIRFECWNKYFDEQFCPSLTIGNNVSMNNNIHIGCINEITIGNNVLIASNVFITDHFHGYVDKRDLNIPPYLRTLYSRGSVHIMDDVWIGENVTIMPNVKLGKSCVVGANSVVTKSFPDYSVIAGVPAKFIKSLKDKKNEL